MDVLVPEIPSRSLRRKVYVLGSTENTGDSGLSGTVSFFGSPTKIDIVTSVCPPKIDTTTSAESTRGTS